MTILINPYILIEALSSFSPLDLSPRAWYDPSDLGSLFQDSAMTTPVTTDGDVVGAMMDKSGNGYHLLQATTANKPLYKTAGGLHWVQFDGVNDTIIYTGSGVALLGDMALYGGWYKNATEGIQKTFARAGKSESQTADLPFNFRADNASPAKLQLLANDTSLLTTTVSTTTFTAAASHVIGFERDVGATVTFYVDGSTDSAAHTEVPTAAGTQAFSLASQTAASPTYHAMRCYGCVVTPNLLATADRDDLASWLADKSGVTL